MGEDYSSQISEIKIEQATQRVEMQTVIQSLDKLARALHKHANAMTEKNLKDSESAVVLEGRLSKSEAALADAIKKIDLFEKRVWAGIIAGGGALASVLWKGIIQVMH